MDNSDFLLYLGSPVLPGSFFYHTSNTSRFLDTVAEQLRVHLLRTLCTELTNLAVYYFSRNSNIQNPEQMSAKVRDANIEDMPGVAKEAFKKLVAALNVKVSLVIYPKLCYFRFAQVSDGALNGARGSSKWPS